MQPLLLEITLFLRILRDILMCRESGSANKNNLYSIIISMSDFIVRGDAPNLLLHEIYAVSHSSLHLL